MYELLFLLQLLVAPLVVEVHAVPADQFAELIEADPCAAARVIAERDACLRPEDCDAFEGWMRLFGEPRTEPLDPRLSERPARPLNLNCLAPRSHRAPRGNGS